MRTGLGQSMRIACVLACAIPPAGLMAQQQQRVKTAVVWQQESKDAGGEVSIQTDGQRLTFRLIDGEVHDAMIDGRPLTDQQIEYVGGNVIRFEGPDGTHFHDFTRGSDLQQELLDRISLGSIPLRGFDGKIGSLELTTTTRSLAPAEDGERTVMIGVQMSVPAKALAGHFGLDPESATLLGAVYPGLPAARAGLKPYDIVVGVDGRRPAGRDVIRGVLSSKSPGDKVVLDVIQAGAEQEFVVELDPFDRDLLHQAGEIGVTVDVETLTSGRDPGAMLFIAPNDIPGGNRWTGAPGFPVDAEMRQMDRLEDRLDRVERLLSRLAERLGVDDNAPPRPAPPTAGEVTP